MKAHGIQLASENEMITVSKEIVGENLAGDSEAAPFYEATKAGLDILPAPHVRICTRPH